MLSQREYKAALQSLAPLIELNPEPMTPLAHVHDVLIRFIGEYEENEVRFQLTDPERRWASKTP
jgi:hypothetical protein